MTNQRYLVSATYLTNETISPYLENRPRIMGFYDVDSPQEAFGAFLDEHAPDVTQAQWFYDDVLVIPVPKNGYSYKLSNVFGQLAKFPNDKYIENEGNQIMTNPKWEEIIVAAPVAYLFEGNKYLWEGLLKNESEEDAEKINHVLEVLGSKSVHIRRGGGAADTEPKENNSEINYDLKQPIPYGIVSSHDNDGKYRFFVYERLTGGTEARLHSKLSIGVGGHMNLLPADGESFMDVVQEEGARELEEELMFIGVGGEVDPRDYETEVIGLINDNSDDVGKVHLGLLYIIKTNPVHSVEVRETEQLKGQWMTVEELEAVEDRLESWSQIALKALKKYA